MDKHVKQIISDILDIPADRVNAAMTMQHTPEWDSLRHMQLILAIEENFGVGPFSAEEIVAMTRCENIPAILEKHLGNGSSPH